MCQNPRLGHAVDSRNCCSENVYLVRRKNTPYNTSDECMEVQVQSAASQKKNKQRHDEFASYAEQAVDIFVNPFSVWPSVERGAGVENEINGCTNVPMLSRVLKSYLYT